LQFAAAVGDSRGPAPTQRARTFQIDRARSTPPVQCIRSGHVFSHSERAAGTQRHCPLNAWSRLFSKQARDTIPPEIRTGIDAHPMPFASTRAVNSRESSEYGTQIIGLPWRMAEITLVL
jgi:hypothetical protein